ncbi:MAG TPA: hypothetical protein VII94_01270, partial [Candidatus Saccharimonadales bacterium]
MPTQKTRRFSLYGYPGTNEGLQQEPIVQQRDPLVSDTGEIGVTWVNTTSQSFFILTSAIGDVNTWTSASAGAATATSFTVNPGDLTVTAGDLNVTAGDLNMAAGSTATLGTLVAGATTLTSTVDITGNTTIGGTLGVTGAVILSSDLTVNGNLIANGDFDITSAAALSFATTSNTNPAISFTTNGGTAETIILTATQGTSVDAIELIAPVGGVTLSGGLASVNAINLTASNAAGGMTF